MKQPALKILVFLLVTILCLPVAFAKHKSSIKDHRHLTSAQTKIVHEVAMRTSMNEDDIAKYVERGLNKHDLFNCYTIWSLQSKDMDEIVSAYENEDKDVAMTLKDFEIPAEDFIELYEAMFPDEERSPIARQNVPWLQAPQR